MTKRAKLIGLATYVVAMGYLATPGMGQGPPPPNQEDTCLICVNSDGQMYGRDAIAGPVQPSDPCWNNEDHGWYFDGYADNTGYYENEHNGPEVIEIGCAYQW